MVKSGVLEEVTAKRSEEVAVLVSAMVNCAQGVVVPIPTSPENVAVPLTMRAGEEVAQVVVALCPIVSVVRTSRPSAVVYPASETDR